MRELTLRVRAAVLEEVLDEVLPALPGGVHVRRHDEEVGLTILLTPGTPGEDELRRLAGPRLVAASSAEASEDWRERRLARYEPLVVADRFLVRPDWAPPSEDPTLTEIVLGRSAAFGTGLHPTTRACLEVLAETLPGESFADVGCGSGVLSIAAAKLGWSSVIAADVDPLSVAAASENAALNGVEIEALRLDATSQAPPPAEAMAANVPPGVHIALTGLLEQAPDMVIASGFQRPDVERVASAWAARGLRVLEEQSAHEWIVLVLG